MGVQVFSVLTEFKFDVAQAVAGSDALQKSTQKLSEAADNALVSVQGLGMGLVSALGIGGIAGLFEKAISASDAFQSSVLDFTGIISSNMNVLQGSVGTFNDRLSASRMIMGDIAKEADRLDLDQGEVFNMAKALLPGMAQAGIAGHNFQNTTAISGMAVGAAPGIGLSGSAMAQQIGQFLGGDAGGALGNRLKSVGAPVAGLDKMGADARFKVLSDGLKLISADMGDAAERANLLSTQMHRFKTLMLGDANGMGSIFKPLGDTIRPLFVGIMKDINGYVKNQGADIVKNFSQLVGSFVSTPKEMLISVLTLKNAQADLGRAAHTLGFISVAQGLGGAIAKLSGRAIFATPIVGQLAFAVSMLGDIFSRTNDPISIFVGHVLKIGAVMTTVAGILSYFGILWKTLSFAFSEVLVPLAGLFMMFQAISMAVAKAHVEDAIALAEILPKITEIFTRIKMAVHNILLPFELAIDGLSEILKPLFMWSMYLEAIIGPLEGFTTLLEGLGTIVVDTLALISGAFSSMFQMLLNYQEKGIFHIFDNLDTAFSEGFDSFVNKHKQKMDEGKNVSNNVTNIGKIEIRNDFKEQMDPDRVAFTMKDQMLKAAQNPTQARGRSLQAGFGAR